MPVVITGNNTPTAGGVTYGDGSTYANTAAGTSGQPLVSGGAGAPAFRPYTLPAADGSANQLLRTNGSGALSFATVSAGFTLGAPVATTSGSTVDYTGIPAGTKQIIVNFKEISISGTSGIDIQIGDSGGIEATGYTGIGSYIENAGTSSVVSSTASFKIRNVGANAVMSGTVVLSLENSTSYTWTAFGILGSANFTSVHWTGSSKSLTAELTQVRITTNDAFDAGEVNIAYI